MRMPCMDGVELLTQVYQRWPHVYRMLLTGFSDMQSLKDAVNQGKILSYIEKPWQNETLSNALDRAMEEVLLQRQQNDQIEHVEQLNLRLKTYKSALEQRIGQRTRQVKNVLHKNQQFTAELYKVLHNFISINPNLDGGFATIVSKTAGNFALHCDLTSKEVNDIELAGQLCEIGLLGLDSEIATQPFSKLNYNQQQLFYSQVDCVHILLAPAQPLQSVEEVLTHQYEHVDGSGYPNHLPVEHIPIGSRILAISRDFWRYRLGKLTGQPMSEKEALRELRKYRGKRYDPALLDIFKNDSSISESSEVKVSYKVSNLKPGMTLKDDLYGNHHMLLLPKGHNLTESCIKKLKRLERLRGKEILLSVKTIESPPLSETLN